MIIQLISTTIFASFLAWYWFKYGMQTSISATYKLLLADFPKAAHSIWLGLFFLLAIGIIASGQTAWHFGSAVGLMGVGAFPEYWEKDEVRKHITAAYLAYALPFVKMAFFTPGWLVPVLAAFWSVFAVLVSLKVIKIQHRTSAIELSGFIVIVLVLCL